jgi:hypothetical protein
VWSGEIAMPEEASTDGQSHSVRFGRSLATVCNAWFHICWLSGSSIVCSAHQTSWSLPAASISPRMSFSAQSMLLAQPSMSLGPMLTTMIEGSKPAARWLAIHSDMFAPGLLPTKLPAWKPTPAACRTGPHPRSASICASDGPHPGTSGASYAEPSITESPITAMAPRGPGASLMTVTHSNSA